MRGQVPGQRPFRLRRIALLDHARRSPSTGSIDWFRQLNEIVVRLVDFSHERWRQSISVVFGLNRRDQFALYHQQSSVMPSDFHYQFENPINDMKGFAGLASDELSPNFGDGRAGQAAAVLG